MVQQPTVVCPEIIGRDRELGALRQAFEEIRSGHSQVIFLSGEAGVGKTRLVDEFKQTSLQTNVTVFVGACFEQDQALPFGLWIEGFHSMLAKMTGAAPKTGGFATSYGKTTQESLRQLIAPFAPEFIKLLPEIIDFFPDIVSSPTLDSEAEKHRLFETWGKFFIQLSRDRPLIMILEDLHWSDDVSLELLEFLSRRILSQPVLLIATYREDEATPHLEHILAQFDRQRLAREIRLGRLNPGESSKMIQRIIQGMPKNGHLVSKVLVDQILNYAQGNPFFIEELLKLYIERGTGEQNALPPIPRSLRDTIQRRTSRLSAGAQQLLTIAAVAGEHFSLTLLFELTHLPETDLLQQVRELMDTSIIVEMPAGDFSFRHALIREAVYASLLVSERQSLHLLIAETIETLFQNRLDKVVPGLAYHYYEAGAWQKALDYGQKAGQSVLSLAAMQEALAHFNRAIAAAHHLGVQPDWQILLSRGKVYERLGDNEPARADMIAALDQARLKQDQGGECEVLISLGFFISAFDFHQSIAYFQQALTVARSIGDLALIGATLNRIGNWYANQDRPDEAGPYHREALEMYENLRDQRGIAHTLELTAMQLYFADDILAGGEACERALSLFHSLGDREGIFYSLLNSQLNYTFDNNITPLIGLDQLEKRGQEALRIAQAMGWRSGEADALHISAMVARASGNYDIALRNEQQAVLIMEEINHQTGLARGLMSLGMIFLDLLVWDKAILVLQQALSIAQATGSSSISTTIYGLLALAHIERNDAGDLQRAAVILNGLSQKLPVRTRHERYCWIARAHLALATGEAQEALQVADSLLASTSHIDTHGPQGVPLLAHLRGDALAALGRAKEASQMFSAARDGSIRQGRKGILWRVILSTGKLAYHQEQWLEAEKAFTQTRAILMELAGPISDEQVRASFLKRGLALIPAVPTAGARKAARQAFGGLTGREQEIARLISEGRANRQIGEELFITERTVERHVSNILLKLDFHRRGQIADWARERLHHSPET